MHVQLIFTPRAYVAWLRDHVLDPGAPSAAPASAHPLAHYIATELWEKFSVALLGLELQIPDAGAPVSPTAILGIRNGIFETYRPGSGQEPLVSYGSANLYCLLPPWTRNALEAQPPTHADTIDPIQSQPWSMVDVGVTARDSSASAPSTSSSAVIATDPTLSRLESEETVYMRNLRAALEIVTQLGYGLERPKTRGHTAAGTVVPREREQRDPLRLALEFSQDEAMTWLSGHEGSDPATSTGDDADAAAMVADAPLMLQEFIVDSFSPLIESLTDARVYLEHGRAKVELCVFEIGMVRYGASAEYRSRAYGCCKLIADLPAWTTAPG